MIKIEETGGVAVVTYDRGERRNALSLQAMNELIDVAHRYASRTDITAIVLAGSAEGFSAGVDLKDPQRWALEDKTLDERRYLASTGARMCKAWESLPQLTIAAIEGFNVGGGIALTLACDWRVMAQSAFLYVPEVQIGIPLVWHTVPRLVNRVGASRAKQIMLLGERMPAGMALEWGLADWLAPDGGAVERARALAAKVAQSPSHVVKMSKESVNAHANALNFVSTYMDVDQALVCGQSAEARQAREQFK
ncbi:enoyl-CoA hydratase/isomerase family protein [Bordetella hinzii]|uniref:Enoyl-CoA hydratase/isomerase family protein n=1 Tax=Bordetella hinzii OH87 BAL007II TaxID=1331262 RepID=A0ABR4QX53_9BORD|nr:enoyl-CoA hydratase/isomerase family protein [Bordetella hinzii]AKQ53995.1 putative enoyl-CoA hydratase echA8 [Bordetella hinzii]KCB22440.1 enoyl-CoA hydratase/isomerase family protein [Bordetella hinzii OH87 BAL007II]KCB29282.1 enoyl-CoA hydratase/isomerase family protein [Bordetella hinzii CA90 BAL1384]KCB33703.1 enoyl-CoA hydratase/isomerase family protein [Bordetella hinzii L60]KCB41853.1 enoyl-CoA hydratase/isomerase family protein [Bordetella hinzii 5132]